MLIYYFYFYLAVRSVLIIHYISNLLLNLMERYFEWANFVSPKNMSNEFFYCVCKQVPGALFFGLNGPT